MPLFPYRPLGYYFLAGLGVRVCLPVAHYRVMDQASIHRFGGGKGIGFAAFNVQHSCP